MGISAESGGLRALDRQPERQSALFNPSLRDFVRAAKTDWNAATLQNKDQRDQVIQDTVLSYAELAKWETLVAHLQEEHAAALKTEQQVSERIKEGGRCMDCCISPDTTMKPIPARWHARKALCASNWICP